MLRPLLLLICSLAVGGCAATTTGSSGSGGATTSTAAATGTTATAGTREVGTARDPGTATAEIPEATTCPATLLETDIELCSSERARCNYPEGACDCMRMVTRCGGMAPRPRDFRLQWVCTYARPMLRPDGCPGIRPAPGAPCSDPGKVCSYPPGHACAAWSSATRTCRDGRWAMPRPSHGPPP